MSVKNHTKTGLYYIDNSNYSTNNLTKCDLYFGDVQVGYFMANGGDMPYSQRVSLRWDDGACDHVLGEFWMQDSSPIEREESINKMIRQHKIRRLS